MEELAAVNREEAVHSPIGGYSVLVTSESNTSDISTPASWHVTSPLY